MILLTPTEAYLGSRGGLSAWEKTPFLTLEGALLDPY